MDKMQRRKVSRFSYEIEAELPVAQVQKAFDQSYRKIQSKINLPGFRKGKVPVDYIRKNYLAEVEQEATQILVEEVYREGLKEDNLHPVGQPQFDFKPIKEGESFQIKIRFDVHPKPTINKFENLKIKMKKPEVNKEQVDKFIERLREASAQQVPVLDDPACGKNHIVHIDISGQVEGGQELPLQKDLSIELGKQAVFKEIEEALMGMKVGGQKNIEIQFPKDHMQFPNKKVKFDIKLNKMFKKEKPEVNDEWAKKFQADTVDQLKESAKKTLQEQAQQNYQNELREKVLSELVKQNPFEVPDSVVQNQKQHLIKDAEGQLRGASPEQVQKFIKDNQKNFDQKSLFHVKAGYLIQSLAEKLGIREDIHQIRRSLEKEMKKQVDDSVLSSVHWQKVQNRVLDTVIQKSKIV